MEKEELTEKLKFLDFQKSFDLLTVWLNRVEKEDLKLTVKANDDFKYIKLNIETLQNKFILLSNFLEKNL